MTITRRHQKSSLRDGSSSAKALVKSAKLQRILFHSFSSILQSTCFLQLRLYDVSHSVIYFRQRPSSNDVLTHDWLKQKANSTKKLNKTNLHNFLARQKRKVNDITFLFFIAPTLYKGTHYRNSKKIILDFKIPVAFFSEVAPSSRPGNS